MGIGRIGMGKLGIGKLGIALAALAVGVPGLAEAQDGDVQTEVVDNMNKVFGTHPGFRATHAKGIVVEGRFRGSPDGKRLSKAVIFAGQDVPVTVRFSDNTGVPQIPDGSADANPHGMAVKYRLPDGGEMDMVTNSLKLFPVSTVAEFRDLLGAIIESPPGSPKPTKAEQFIAAHPTVVQAAKSVSTPDSLAHEEYRGLNAFVLVSATGDRKAVRFLITPERIAYLDPADAAKREPDFLMSELPERLKAGPVTFKLRAQVAAPGDPTVDPSRPWPEDRAVVDLGTFTLDRAVADSREAEKPLLFLPGQISDGVELSDDPMVDIRNGAYAISFSRRQ